MSFSEPRAGQAFKEAFTRLGYRKLTNSHEEAIHRLIGMKTLFTYLLVQGSCFAIPLLSCLDSSQSPLPLSRLDSSQSQSSVLSTCIFSHQSKFNIYCTQNSGRLKSFMNIYHMFTLWSGSTGPRKSTYDTRLSLGACIEGVVWGRDYCLFGLTSPCFFLF